MADDENKGEPNTDGPQAVVGSTDPMSKNRKSPDEAAADIKERDTHLKNQPKKKAAPRRKAAARRAPARRAAAPKEDAAPAAAKKAPVGMGERTWVILEDSDDIPPTGLFVSHNGNPFLLTTGVPIQVPNHILQLLDDAVMSTPQIDPVNKRVLGYRERSRFPYRQVAAPKN